MKTWVEFSKRGFSNEMMVRCFDSKDAAIEFVEDHLHYAKIVTEKQAMKNNDFGYYIYNDDVVYCE